MLCPPLGIEAICAYFTYRKVAVRLAEAGLAVLRVDYDGTGDSFGDSTEPNRVASWTDSVGSAIDTLEQIGVDRVALLGMRVGALLAALAAARRERIDALVLWDPCLTGSSFVREQQALSGSSKIWEHLCPGV